MLRKSILKAVAVTIAGSATVHAQQQVVAVAAPQPVATVSFVAAPAQVAVTPQTLHLPAVSVPATVVNPVPGVSSLASTMPAQPTVAVTNTIPHGAIAQQAQVYTPTFYYYYYTPPYPAPAPVPSYAPPLPPAMMAPMAPVVPFAPMYDTSMYGGSMYDIMSVGYPGQFGPLFNARGESGHVRYPYYSYRRPWYYSGQPSFNVTIPGHVW